MTLPNLSEWAKKKGISLLGTGDFTHPAWIEAIESELVETKPGLYQLRGAGTSDPYFLLSAEVASIYKQGDKVRRVHNIILAPSVAGAKKLRELLEKRGVNLKADGRPIMGVPCDELVKLCKDADPYIELIPAHAWTPHFGVFGSLSGFDSIEEAFKDQSQYIFAFETGLSSDPKMNWQVGSNDRYTLISNSDAHSLRKLGREANVFEVSAEQLSYREIIRIIKNKNPDEFIETIEFFPEEGKYHLDGHRDCKFSCLPEKTKQLGGVCPVCGKKLLVGVLNRIDELASRASKSDQAAKIPFRNIVPLEELISETLGVGVASKKVAMLYEQMVAKASEFEILLNIPTEDIVHISSAAVAETITRMRSGSMNIIPGYDGVFGKIQVYGEHENKPGRALLAQPQLF